MSCPAKTQSLRQKEAMKNPSGKRIPRTKDLPNLLNKISAIEFITQLLKMNEKGYLEISSWFYCYCSLVKQGDYSLQ